jgi:ribokinase
MNGRVCVVGSANMDLVTRTAVLPQPGQTVVGLSFDTFSGGKGANQAVAAARAGARVSFVGCVGDDAYGAQLQRGLLAEDINTHYVAVEQGLPSGIALITVDDDGQNSIVVVPGANGALRVAAVQAAQREIAKCNVLVLQLETPLESAFAAATIARQAGALVILNPAPARPLPHELLGLCDVLVPNAGEAALITGHPVDTRADALAAGRLLLAQGVGSVIITLGGNGALLVTPDEQQYVPAFPVQVVDTTAAGDAFVGAYAAARANGAANNVALRWATAAGALATTRAGAQPALPYRLELQLLTASEMAQEIGS